MKKTMLMLLLLAFSCQKEEATAPEAADMKRLRAEIDSLIADKACGAERTCGAIGLGSKPCGGHWMYLSYSLRAADVPLLARKVAAYNQLEAALNRRENRVSDCTVMLPPAVACTDGQCKNL